MSETLNAEQLWRIPRVGDPVAAGDTVVVPVTTHDLEKHEGRTRLWRVDPDGGDPVPLTTPDASATKPALSPDGRRLAFLREHDGARQVYVLDLAGGEGVRVTSLPLGALGARWMPDGEALVVVAMLFRGHDSIEATQTERERRSKDPVTARVTEDAVYRFWDRWLTDGRVPHLFLVPAVEGAPPRHLTPGFERWMRWDNVGDPLSDVSVSPDGAEIAFVADRSEAPHRDLRWTLFLVNPEDGAPRDATPDLTGHVTGPRHAPDGQSLVYGMQRIPDFYADRVRIVRWDRTPDVHHVLTEDWDHSAAGWAFVGDDLVFAAEDAGRTPLWRMPLAGGAPVRLATSGTLSVPAVTGDGTVFASEHGLDRPPEVVRVDPESVVPVTRFARPGLEGTALGSVEERRFPGTGGVEIQLFLVHPPEDPGGPAPLVHMIHGGPHGVFGDAWHWRWNAQVFAAPRRLVAMVNFHGSTSFGEAFTQSIQGAWGDRPARDVEAATDLLVEEGLTDSSRMAVTGGSYGGYLVSWLVSQTDRYACAVAHAAVTDLPGMYASDVTMGRTRSYGAEVFEDLERVQRWSPSAHAGGYATPTLVIHGDRDFRVPITQGLEFYGVLKAKGIEARLVTYPDENHWVLSSANSIHWYGEVLGWLDRFLS
jgi:dipeptidyl aminopeptidase/acylaminoacyl peptidase